MPYGSTSDLPSQIKSKYSPKCQRAFLSAFNGTHDKTGDEGKSFASAHAAAKRCQQASKEGAMPGSLAAPKMPPLKPGEFRFVTKSLEIEKSLGEEGQSLKRRFKTIASSTIKDLGNDEIKLSALEDLRNAFKSGKNIFYEHDHDARKIFGRTDWAEIIKSNERDEKGNEIWDLHIAGNVNVPNETAREIADSIDGGYVVLGTSIGAIVKDFKQNADGGMDIYHLDGQEGSIVGIPMNQRSWTYKAANAARRLDAEQPGVFEEDDVNNKPIEDESPAVVPPDTSPAPEKVEESPHHEETPGPGTAKGLAADLLEKTGSVPEGFDESKVHFAVKSESELPGAPAEKEATPGGQEADPATPETAPTDEDKADPAEGQKADDIPVEDVEALVKHVGKLVERIGQQDSEIKSLRDEIDSMKTKHAQLQTVEEDTVAAIEKVMALPLQRRAVGHVDDLKTRYPDIFHPEVTRYLNLTEEK